MFCAAPDFDIAQHIKQVLGTSNKQRNIQTLSNNSFLLKQITDGPRWFGKTNMFHIAPMLLLLLCAGYENPLLSLFIWCLQIFYCCRGADDMCRLALFIWRCKRVNSIVSGTYASCVPNISGLADEHMVMTSCCRNVLNAVHTRSTHSVTVTHV